MSNPVSISAFSDIADLGVDQIKEIIARVGRDDFALALKAASEPLKERVRSSVTEEEWQAMTSYMEFLGPIRLSDVEFVQLQIVRKFRGAASDDQFV
jgi:flagellar motor switch protein FliG